jgi:GxxExxY protein
MGVEMREGKPISALDINKITESIIGAAIEVHKYLGPGLLESAYEECLAKELSLRKIPFKRQVPLPVVYKGNQLDCGYRIDLLVNDEVIVELKTVDCLQPIHDAQVLTYMRLGSWKVGLLLNFNSVLLKHGIKRLALNLPES